jgi:tRNA (cytidine32/uridine32-2'-O)-methyltransferase
VIIDSSYFSHLDGQTAKFQSTIGGAYARMPAFFNQRYRVSTMDNKGALL